MKKPKYNISDFVYHIVPESERGVVIDCKYLMSSDKWEYQVAFSAMSESLWYMEHELTTSKNYN